MLRRVLIAVAIPVVALAFSASSPARDVHSSQGEGPPPPVLGKTFSASVQKGTIRIKRKGAKKFRRLNGFESIPTGSAVDARKGTVGITTAFDKKGKTQFSSFFDGVFKVTQAAKRGAYTSMTLNGRLENCSKKSSTAKKRRKGRRLWGDGKGRFRTRGRRSAATVRGTVWLVYDRCDASTYTAVRRGTVNVRDFGRKKTIKLKAGKHYIAR
jgi:hypothetical protein